MSEVTQVVQGSGNVYVDLGFDDPEMELNRAELARKINALIEARHLTQAAAAKVLGIDQPKVSAIRRGRLTGFSVERLMKLLTRLDQDVRITVEPKREQQAPGRIEVVAAR